MRVSALQPVGVGDTQSHWHNTCDAINKHWLEKVSKEGCAWGRMAPCTPLFGKFLLRTMLPHGLDARGEIEYEPLLSHRKWPHG